MTEEMMNPEIGKLYWFVHLDSTPPVPLGFVRGARDNAFIIGGKTGSHGTGHGESYWQKLKEVIAMGYTPVDVARNLGFLPDEWTPPELSRTDREHVEKHRK